MDRFKLLEDENKKVFIESDKILSKYNLQMTEDTRCIKNIEKKYFFYPF